MASPVINKAITLDFNAMTMEQLFAESARLAVVLDLATSQRREIFRIGEARKALASSRERISGMNTIEKDALMTALKEAP